MIVCIPSIAAVTGLRMYQSGGYGFCSGRRYIGRFSKLWKWPGIAELIVAEPFANDRQGFPIARVVGLGVGFLAPEERFHHAAAPHADLQPPPLRLSSMLISSISRSGWCSGST